MLYYNRRPGSRTLREQVERGRVLVKRMQAEGNDVDLMLMPYGGDPVTEDGKLLKSGFVALFQQENIRYTTEGDFSHLAAATVRI